MDADRRMQARRRLPGPVAHAGDEFAVDARGMQRDSAAVASNYMPRVSQAKNFDLQPLDGGIDIAGRAASRRLFTEHMPRLDGLPQLHVNAALGDVAVLRKAEFKVRGKPGLLK